jgi:osmoprotectant transport system substrate-binding protein
VRRFGVLLICLLALALAAGACGSDDDAPEGEQRAQPRDRPGAGKPEVTLGTKNFTEQYILGELYAQALRDRGFTVRLKPDIGSSEIIDRALGLGSIDLYPEYIGVIAVELARAKERLTSKRQTYEIARRYERKRGFTLLEATPFSDSLALAVKPAFAERHDLEEVGDLARLGPFTFGGAPENLTRYQGLVGMRKAYGIDNAKFRVVPLGKQYDVLEEAKADVVNVLTTDGQLARGDYVVLEDTKGIFGFQNLAPVVSDKVLREQGPAFAETLNAVSAKLTNEAMQRMNAAVDIDGRPPADVAREFLRSQDLA